VEKHIEKVILVSSDATFLTGAMDGKPWENPGAVTTILKQTSEFSHLSDVLVRFFQGALETWKRFTTEFTPGGVINEATGFQKELSWMPATNDVNEGILGSYRQFT
jgi:hypothetical protein